MNETIKEITKGNTTFQIDTDKEAVPTPFWIFRTTGGYLWKDGTVHNSTRDPLKDISTDMFDWPGYFKSLEEAEKAIELFDKPKGRTLKELAKETLEIQSACNPLGLSKGYARALTDLRQELERLGLPCDTKAVCEHPINVWWVDKLSDLSGRPSMSLLSEGYSTLVNLSNQEDM